MDVSISYRNDNAQHLVNIKQRRDVSVTANIIAIVAFSFGPRQFVCPRIQSATPFDHCWENAFFKQSPIKKCQLNHLPTLPLQSNCSPIKCVTDLSSVGIATGSFYDLSASNPDVLATICRVLAYPAYLYISVLFFFLTLYLISPNLTWSHINLFIFFFHFYFQGLGDNITFSGQ